MADLPDPPHRAVSCQMAIWQESYPLREAFRISRGSKTVAEVVVVELTAGPYRGWGECVPYARYGESVSSVIAALEGCREAVVAGLDRTALQQRLPPGAARNALDCALWSLEARRGNQPVWKLAGLTAPPQPVTTAYTLSVASPDAMARAAAAAADRPLLKLKLTGEGDLERVRAVRAHAPRARLIVDANEAWSLEHLHRFTPEMAELGVELIEQPLPADADSALAGFVSPVPLGADESVHGLESLARLQGLYQVVNIKLDKTGGLTEALALKQAAVAAGFAIMVGCMVGTSLAMAPAHLLAQNAAFVDLDGPLLLAADRQPGLVFTGSRIAPPEPALWG